MEDPKSSNHFDHEEPSENESSKSALYDMLSINNNELGKKVETAYVNYVNSFLDLIHEIRIEYGEQLIDKYIHKMKMSSGAKVDIIFENPDLTLLDSQKDELITKTETAIWLQVPIEKINYWVAQSLLKPYTINSEVYFTKGQVKEVYLETHHSS